MTNLRTAAQQALEAWDAGDTEWFKRAYTVMEALRAALAEPVQEPVAGRAFLERILAAMEGVIDVADRKTDEFDALRSCVIDLTLMLHTAPPRKPLTEEEIDAEWRKAASEEGFTTAQFVRNFARAIERAHEIV